MDNMSDKELMEVAGFADIFGDYAELSGQYTIEQLEAVIELLKRAQA